ncbi:MAG TPA: DUF4249 family protein [Ohtaekwangia sp.]|uniref:DUF4249 family protein n=1 Tax=Ohtaekwangia sp. TaxID=2066019 RepID=UPI002F928C69
MRTQRLLGMILLFVSLSCEEAIDLPLKSEDTNLIVVESILTNENTNHLVRLTHPYKTQNETPVPVSGATVTISDETTLYTLTELPAGSGEYYTPLMRAVTDKVYTLHILYNEKEYTASDSAVPVEALSILHYAAAGSGYQLVLNPEGQSPNYIEHAISWQNTSACTGSDCSGELIYYDLKTIDVNEIYKPDKEDFYFPAGSTIIRRKYSMSTAYKEFLRSMLSETEWRGGIFDVQRDNTTTNLSEGAIGFFAVSTVVADTTVVQ